MLFKMSLKMKQNGSKKRSSVKRLFCKAVWFAGTSTFILILGIAIFLALLAITGESNFSQTNLIVLTWLDTFLLVNLLVVITYIFRNKKRVLIRWTRKSFFILIPLIFISAGLVSVLLLTQGESIILPDQQRKNDTTDFAVGDAEYIENLSFDNKLLLEATNRERGGVGINPLVMNGKLTDSAQNKCEDMVAQNYWSHDSPGGVEPWSFLSKSGYNHDKAGENLAFGFVKESDVIKGWMDSPSHKKNLLDSAFTEIGFGVCKSDNFVDNGKQLIVVQHLARPGSVNTQMNRPRASIPKPKPYVASVCTKKTIPYKTKYENVSYLYVGETDSYGGTNGYTETCTADSTGYKPADFTSQPFDKTVLVGTKPKPAEE